MTHYQVQIDVKVTDVADLRAYALARAIDAGITEENFNEGEHDNPEDNIDYLLSWAFDAGTPLNCGFEIEDSRAVFEGDMS